MQYLATIIFIIYVYLIVNYPFAKDKWASDFTDLRFFTEVLFEKKGTFLHP